MYASPGRRRGPDRNCNAVVRRLPADFRAASFLPGFQRQPQCLFPGAPFRKRECQTRSVPVNPVRWEIPSFRREFRKSQILWFGGSFFGDGSLIGLLCKSCLHLSPGKGMEPTRYGVDSYRASFRYFTGSGLAGIFLRCAIGCIDGKCTG